jgi:hypothetical protein
MKNLLAGIETGELDLLRLEVTYDSMHPFWGGLTLTIKGSGEVEQKAVRQAVGQTKRVTREDLLRLANLLLQEEAWAQRTAERTMVPDESRVRLTIRYGDEESAIWERHNHLQVNQRIVHIRDLMFEIAWVAAVGSTAGIVNETGTSIS